MMKLLSPAVWGGRTTYKTRAKRAAGRRLARWTFAGDWRVKASWTGWIATYHYWHVCQGQNCDGNRITASPVIWDSPHWGLAAASDGDSVRRNRRVRYMGDIMAVVKIRQSAFVYHRCLD